MQIHVVTLGSFVIGAHLDRREAEASIESSDIAQRGGEHQYEDVNWGNRHTVHRYKSRSTGRWNKSGYIITAVTLEA